MCKALWSCWHCMGWTQPVICKLWWNVCLKEVGKLTKNPSPRMQERVTQFFAAPVTFTSVVVFLKEVDNLHVQNWRNRVLPECSRPIRCSYCTDEHCEVGEENEADGNVHQLHHVVRSEPADCAYVVKGGNVELQEHPVICVATQIHLWVYLWFLDMCKDTSSLLLMENPRMQTTMTIGRRVPAERSK